MLVDRRRRLEGELPRGAMSATAAASCYSGVPSYPNKICPLLHSGKEEVAEKPKPEEEKKEEIWDRHGDRALKNEFRVLYGRIDDLQWSPDCQTIAVVGRARASPSFVRSCGIQAPTLIERSMAIPAALVVVPLGLLFLLSGLIANLIQISLFSSYNFYYN